MREHVQWIKDGRPVHEDEKSDESELRNLEQGTTDVL